MKVTKENTLRQSRITFNKWKDIWDANVEANFKNCKGLKIDRPKKDKCIIFSFGPSFKNNADLVKKNNMHYTHDIVCVDKALSYLLEIGIIPKFVVVADANIKFDNVINNTELAKKYIKRMTLLSAGISHPSWSNFWNENDGNIAFYINKDAILTHKRYSKQFNYDPYYGPQTAIIIPAAINVGNAAYVLMSLVVEYPVILLAGFDYSFTYFGKYYGTKEYTAVHRFLKADKKKLDNHISLIGIDGNLVHTSHSMLFSTEWLYGFISQMEKVKKIQTVNITGKGILAIPRQAKLKGA